MNKNFGALALLALHWWILARISVQGAIHFAHTGQSVPGSCSKVAAARWNLYEKHRNEKYSTFCRQAHVYHHQGSQGQIRVVRSAHY